jgi:hypothetical protein
MPKRRRRYIGELHRRSRPSLWEANGASIDRRAPRTQQKQGSAAAHAGWGAAGDNIVFLKPVPLSETRRSHAFRGENFVDVVEKYTQMMKREN